MDLIFIMSNFKLDVDSPFDIPSKENYMEKPEKIKYSDNYIKFKHYGKIVPKLIERAIKTSDKKQKDELIFYIANHMKKCYLTWNKSSVDDEVIFKHLKILSNNELKLKEDTKLYKLLKKYRIQLPQELKPYRILQGQKLYLLMHQ